MIHFGAFIPDIVLSALVFACLSLSSSLAMMVHQFGCSVTKHDLALEDAMDKWNLLEALMRRGSSAIEGCLLVFSAHAMCAACLIILDTEVFDISLARCAPALLLSLNTLRVLLAAGHVSNECTRMVCLINFCSFGPNTEVLRERVVNYIRNSSVGFYVFETRITYQFVLKASWVFSAFMFALITRVLG